MSYILAFRNKTLILFTTKQSAKVIVKPPAAKPSGGAKPKPTEKAREPGKAKEPDKAKEADKTKGGGK